MDCVLVMVGTVGHCAMRCGMGKCTTAAHHTVLRRSSVANGGTMTDVVIANPITGVPWTQRFTAVP